jgi:hypothetical protein
LRFSGFSESLRDYEERETARRGGAGMSVRRYGRLAGSELPASLAQREKQASIFKAGIDL